MPRKPKPKPHSPRTTTIYAVSLRDPLPELLENAAAAAGVPPTTLAARFVAAGLGVDPPPAPPRGRPKKATPAD